MAYDVYSVFGEWWTSSEVFRHIATPWRMGTWHHGCAFLIMLGTLLQMRGVLPIRRVRPTVVIGTIMVAHGLVVLVGLGVRKEDFYASAVAWDLVALWLVLFMYLWRIQIRRELTAKGLIAPDTPPPVV